MRMLAFANRNWKEISRDPLTLGFGAAFPLILLLLMTLIQSNVPVEVFAMESLLPGIMGFGQSFLALFAALLISRDRASALMQRLLTAPMGAADFLLGYALPLLPLELLQGLLCIAAAWALGFAPGWNHLALLGSLLPGALFNIALGLIFGCLLTERQVGGVCGAALTNVGAWLSGAWFDLKLVGGAFERIARCLPFAANVDAARAALAGDFAAMWPCLGLVTAYALACSLIAGKIFVRRLRFP